MLKPKQIIVDGIHFRSKLEARWYLFMKKLGWNIVYEPEIEGLNGWIPDFLILGKNKKILVEVKPIDKIEEWENHPDRKKIENSGVSNLNYEILILGTNLTLDGDSQLGLLYPIDGMWPEGRKPDDPVTGEVGDTILKPIMNYKISSPIFSYYDGQYGFMDLEGLWHCRITGEGGKTYLNYRGGSESEYNEIDKNWNQAWSALRWKGKEVQ
jgi:hypothetical protein